MKLMRGQGGYGVEGSGHVTVYPLGDVLGAVKETIEDRFAVLLYTKVGKAKEREMVVRRKTETDLSQQKGGGVGRQDTNCDCYRRSVGRVRPCSPQTFYHTDQPS